MTIPQHRPGKVLEICSSKDEDVISSNKSTQIMVKMWDENLFTFTASPNLEGKIKSDDIVLVDYHLLNKFDIPIPRAIITKVLRKNKAERIWKEYKKRYEKMKKQKPTSPQLAIPERYIG